MANPAIAPDKFRIKPKPNVVIFPKRRLFPDPDLVQRFLANQSYVIFKSRSNIREWEKLISRQYFKEIGEIKQLSKSEQIALAKLAKTGDIEARNELAIRFLMLVVAVAKKYRGRGLEFMDLIQEGNIGLVLDAIKGWNYKLGYSFAPYAAACIRSALRLAVRDKGSLIKIPHATQIIWNKIVHVFGEFIATERREPNIAELAKATGYTPKQIKLVVKRMQIDVVLLDDSVNRMVEDGEVISISSMPAALVSSQKSPEQVALAKSELFFTCNYLRQLLDLLRNNFSTKVQNIFRARYGLDGTFEIKSWAEVGRRHNRATSRIFKNTKSVWRELARAGYPNDEIWLLGEIERTTNLAELANCNYVDLKKMLFGFEDISDMEKRSNFRNEIQKKSEGRLIWQNRVSFIQLNDLANGGMARILQNINESNPSRSILLTIFQDHGGRINRRKVKEILSRAMKDLPARERKIVVDFYFNNLTMKEIGEILGVSEYWVSQARSRALITLTQKLVQDLQKNHSIKPNSEHGKFIGRVYKPSL